MKLLTEAEAAERLRVAPRTLTKWRWAGRGPKAIKIGSWAVRYAEAEIERFIAEGAAHQPEAVAS